MTGHDGKIGGAILMLAATASLTACSRGATRSGLIGGASNCSRRDRRRGRC